MLQRNGTMTANQLAKRLEVSERTVLRDISALSVSGVPVYAERGSKGGFRIIEGYELDLSGLRSVEIRTLFLRGNDRLLTDLGWRQDAMAAWNKVSSAIPQEQQSIATELMQRFYIDEAPWFHREDPSAPLKTIQDAIWKERCLDIIYDKPDGRTANRVVNPYALVAKVGVWYLVGEREHELRVYRVSRIKRIGVLDDTFERKSSFNLMEFWDSWTREFEHSRPKYEVYLWVKDEALPDFMNATPWLTVDGEVRIDGAEPDGYVGVRVNFETMEMACRHVLGFGDQLRVIEPQELRSMIVERARSVLRM